jgi:predicted MFS family arabinose efflux permease
MQLCSMCFIGANSVWTTVYVLFLTRQLGLEAWQVGGLLAAGGPGALVGSILAQRVVNRFGLGQPIVITQVLASASLCLVPLAATTPALLALPLLVLAAFSSNLMITLGSVCELTLRQQVTPDRLQGRMNATMRSLNWSTVAAGALVGGLLGEQLGVVPTLVVGTTGSLLSAGWVIWSPLRYEAARA